MRSIAGALQDHQRGAVMRRRHERKDISAFQIRAHHETALIGCASRA
jgi:hypothetical protein